MQESSFFRKAGQQFLNPILRQGFQGNLVPGTPEDVTKTGMLFSNILQNNLGITKQDETGSFQFDPYQSGFSLDTPKGFGFSVYGNKMSASPPGFEQAPMGPTVEARFKFGSDPNASTPFSDDLQLKDIKYTGPTEVNAQEEDLPQGKSAGRKFLEEYITPEKVGEAVRYYY